MTNEQLRMQMLAGVITESQYKAKIQENEEKESLNEHFVAGGIVGIPAINPVSTRQKTDYEDAFEYFLSQKYSINEEMESGSEVEEFLDGMINDSIPEDSEEGEEVKGVWEAEEYADEDAYGEAAQEFKNAHEYIMGKGGETTIEGNPDVTYTALPNGDIAYSLITTLDEGKEVEEPTLYEDETSEMEAQVEDEIEMNETEKPGTAKERSAMAKKARAGKDIGEKGKNFEKIAKSAGKKYGSEEAGKRVAGAVMYGKLKK